jgi:hypothetical protein
MSARESRKGRGKCLVNATVARSRFFLFFPSGERGEYKSLIAITGDNSGDRSTFWRREKEMMYKIAASCECNVRRSEFADSLHDKATKQLLHQQIVSSPRPTMYPPRLPNGIECDVDNSCTLPNCKVMPAMELSTIVMLVVVVVERKDRGGRKPSFDDAADKLGCSLKLTR